MTRLEECLLLKVKSNIIKKQTQTIMELKEENSKCLEEICRLRKLCKTKEASGST